jgi:hypothetical protein
LAADTPSTCAAIVQMRSSGTPTGAGERPGRQELEQLVQAVAGVDPAAGVINVKLAAYAAVAITNHVASWYQPWGELALDDVVDGLLSVYRPVSPAT